MSEKRSRGTSAVLDAPAVNASMIRFPEPMPGLTGAFEWQLVEMTDARPFFCLRSVDRPGLSLVVIDPRLVASGYAPKIPQPALTRVAASSPETCLLLSTVTVEQPGSATVNLRAPLVINPEAMIGTQVILDDPRWPIRHRLAAEGAAGEGQGGPVDAGPEPQGR